MTIKQRSAKLLVASLLLMTFVVGQLIVIAHSHKSYLSHQSQTKKGDTDDKCKTCAQNNHAQLFYQQQQDLFTLTVVIVKCYQSPQNNYNSIKLHRSCNKGPPLG